MSINQTGRGGDDMESDYRFPATRAGLTRKIQCGLDIYLTVNARPDGSPGEIFVRLGKQGSTVSGLVQAWAVALSAALQRGVEWTDIRSKFIGMRFEPRTHEYDSIVDAIARNVDAMLEEFRNQVDDQRGQQHLPFGEEEKSDESAGADGGSVSG